MSQQQRGGLPPPFPHRNIPLPPSNTNRFNTSREMERLSDPVLSQKRIDKWKIIAGIAFSIAAGGFSAAIWLDDRYASEDDLDKVVESHERLSANINKLTVQMTKLTTVLTASGKMQEEMRKDLRSVQEDLRKPRWKRTDSDSDSDGELPSFVEVLESVHLENIERNAK